MTISLMPLARKTKMCEENASLLVYLTNLSKIRAECLSKICLKIVQKALKWPFGACPRTPLEPFFALKFASN